jgi:hypothetical protein
MRKKDKDPALSEQGLLNIIEIERMFENKEIDDLKRRELHQQNVEKNEKERGV